MNDKKPSGALINGERNGTHMMIIDALVRLGVNNYSTEAYNSISETLGVSYRVVRRTHEANLCMIDRMISLERDLIQAKAELARLKGMVFLGLPPDSPQLSDDAETVETGPNMEEVHMQMALRTVDLLLEMQRGAVVA